MALEAQRKPAEGDHLLPHSEGEAGEALARLCEFLHADAALLATVLSSGETTRLLPLAEHGGGAVSLRAILSLPEADAFARDVLTSILPSAWTEPGATADTLPRWCRSPSRQLPMAGLALPLAASRGSGGIAIFVGEGLALTEGTVCDAHVRCLMLFRSLSGDGCAAAASPLSPRELECLRLTADGLTSDEIAAQLGLSVHTANQYLSNTIAKLNAVNRMHAVAKAMRAGLFD